MQSTHRLRLTWERLFHLVRRDIKSRYKDTVLGLMWILLTPLIQAIVISFVLAKVMGIRASSLPPELFPFVILTGLTAWNMISHSISNAMTIFVNNRDLVRNQPIPLILLPLSTVVVKLFDFVVETVFLLPLLALIHHPVGAIIGLLVPFTLALFLFTVGVSLIFSTIYMYIRDIGHLVSFILSIWFWVSPIFYPAELIPSHLRFFNLNPLVHILATFRQILLYQQADPVKLSKLLLMSLVVAVVGVVIFQRQRKIILDIP